MWLSAQFHAALFHILFFYEQSGSVIMLRLAAHTVHYDVINNRFVERITTRRVTSGGVQYGAPCVKLRNIKFCILFWLILVKLRAISYIVAIYVYCCNMC